MKNNIFDPDVRRVIKRIAQVVARDGFDAVAERAGVSGQTLRNWTSYRVLNPQSGKLFAVARACGMRIHVE